VKFRTFARRPGGTRRVPRRARGPPAAFSYSVQIVLMVKGNYSHGALMSPTESSVRARVLSLHVRTLDICVVVDLLSSGQAWRAGAGGAGGSGGVQRATGALRAPPASRRGPPARNPSPLRAERSRAGAVQPGDRRPADPRAQRRGPRIPAVVRGRSDARARFRFFVALLRVFDPHCAGCVCVCVCVQRFDCF